MTNPEITRLANAHARAVHFAWMDANRQPQTMSEWWDELFEESPPASDDHLPT